MRAMLTATRAIPMLVAGALAASPVVARDWVPTASAGARIDGVWRSRGYGHILTIARGVPRVYHVAGTQCYRDPSPDAGKDESYRLVSVTNRDRIAFTVAPGTTDYAFDRIGALPAACATPRDWSRQAIADVVAATFADLYPGFGPRGRTVPELTAALTDAGKSPTDAALYARLTTALGRLDDAHVGLEASIDGEDRSFEGGEAPTILAARADPRLGDDPAMREKRWSTAYRQGILDLLGDSAQTVANRRILWGRIGRIGYINIVAMGAFDPDAGPDDTTALDTALDGAIAAFRDLPGVIVDVTNNRGGYDSISLHIAGRFADRTRPAFIKRPAGVAGADQRFAVTPSPRPRYTGPVALLTSDITVSAGETFTLAMRALPTVRHMGATTRGALSDQLAKPLPNGWTLTLPAERYRDPAGQSQEGIGITPAEPIPAFAPDHTAMIVEAARRLNQ
ncbi:hypothetical protein ASE75_09380 [Sphingomonas sp. Leaf17]|uniref:S41 family peptidase n=1 Tax=Sphingomonas sp. Leaf17 TaxID=1735683 RepID=UPI0006FB7C1A|nr:S41 family peptidase [Sphingomonas sp. Leaf17]KQM64202.1 hypothetical protein ASE75_09380 [Sphingomonas sp. Leaf17]